MSMRKLLRSISPFSKRNVTVEDPGPTVSVNPSTSTKPTWSIQGTDLKKVLTTFYSRYNPDKISAIEEILAQYQGEEMVLLYELAEVYNLNQSQMQLIIEDSKKSDTDVESNAASERKSRSRQPVPSRPQEYSSVAAPQWEKKRDAPERVSHKSLPAEGRRSKHNGDLNSYRPKYDISTAPKRVPSVSTTTTESQCPDDTGSSKVTPMSLQDIINTSRKNDSLTKKSVRFSPNLELSTSAPGVNGTYHSLSRSAATNSRHSTEATGEPMARDHVRSRGISSEEYNSRESSVSGAQSRPFLVDSPSGTGIESARTQVPEQMRPQSAPSARTIAHAVNADFASNQDEKEDQAYAHADMLKQQQVQYQEQIDISSSSSPRPYHAINTGAGHNDIDDGQVGGANDAGGYDDAIIGGNSGSSRPGGNRRQESVRTQSVGLEEIKRELERTRQALSEADKERFEVLHLLQEVAAAPFEMQEVVERYLDKYGKRRTSISADNCSGSGDNGSGAVGGWHLQDLEGRPLETYGGSPSLLPKAQDSEEERPYMLGTVSSAKRKMDSAVAGKASGNYVPLARMTAGSPGGSSGRYGTETRGRSTSRERHGGKIGGRWVRPSSQQRSPSQSGSIRSASPAPSVGSEQDTNRYDRRQPTHEQFQAQRRIDVKQRQRPASPQTPTAAGKDDWVACVDPKTNRTYYYSSSRKKSSWTIPVADELHKQSWTPAQSNTVSKIFIPTGSRNSTPTSSRAASPVSSRASSRERGVTFAASGRAERGGGPGTARGRSPSPAGSGTWVTRQQTRRVRSPSPSGSEGSHRSGSSFAASTSGLRVGSTTGDGEWTKAVDPKSGRPYWFNRTTRQSTWKRPAGAAP